VYLLTGGELRQLTEDHSLVETMVRGGQLSPDEAAVHPGRNVLTRALGIEPEIEVDLFHEPVRAGDRYLLCSDGLFNELHDDQISAVLRRLAEPWDAAAELVRLAAEAGGRDNITAVIVDVVEGDALDGVDGLIGTHSREAASATDDPLGLTAQPTEQVPAVDASAPAPAAPPPLAAVTPVVAPPKRRRRSRPTITWRVWAFVAAIIIVVGVAIGAVLVSSDDDPADFVPSTTSSSSTTSTSTSTSSTTSTVATTTTVAPAVPPAQ
jgi:protein phosphatase